ncbi:hypothetical protein PCH_Pc13g08310 [Penicillium rubens Wisconsin 54-1255]|uniref:Uncharacterized protein n=1 Tax=Penicillium rubens (strain ATCC 28089 / DSM 1075 / NRRL 1951 / Wisconsin 54-1255) TaxID=500485 RepID=B6H4B8_PENRW|nr:hypothetical protein PCH_Pc13g08310 [Penicillium rubens Wisconsin 54-1255]
MDMVYGKAIPYTFSTEIFTSGLRFSVLLAIFRRLYPTSLLCHIISTFSFQRKLPKAWKSHSELSRMSRLTENCSTKIPLLSATLRNNLGYSHSSVGSDEKAKDWFETSEKWWHLAVKNGDESGDHPTRHIVTHARCLIYLNEYTKAENILHFCIARLKTEYPLDWAMLAHKVPDPSRAVFSRVLSRNERSQCVDDGRVLYADIRSSQHDFTRLKLHENAERIWSLSNLSWDVRCSL